MELNKYVFFVDRTTCLLLLSVDTMKYYALEGLSRDMVLALSRLGKCKKQTLLFETLKSNYTTKTMPEQQMLNIYNKLVKLKIIKE